MSIDDRISAHTQTGVFLEGLCAPGTVDVTVTDASTTTPHLVFHPECVDGTYALSFDATSQVDGEIIATALQAGETVFDAATKDTVAPATTVVISPDPIATTAHAALTTLAGACEIGREVNWTVEDASPLTQRVSGFLDCTSGTYSVVMDSTTLRDGVLTALVLQNDGFKNTTLASDTATKAIPTCQSVSGSSGNVTLGVGSWCVRNVTSAATSSSGRAPRSSSKARPSVATFLPRKSTGCERAAPSSMGTSRYVTPPVWL